MEGNWLLFRHSSYLVLVKLDNKDKMFSFKIRLKESWQKLKNTMLARVGLLTSRRNIELL